MNDPLQHIKLILFFGSVVGGNYSKETMTDSEALVHVGFIAFVHMNPKQRDGKKRLVWMGVVQEELVTVRLVAELTGWQVDYVHAQAADLNRFLASGTVAELVAFITQVRAEGGAWPVGE